MDPTSWYNQPVADRGVLNRVFLLSSVDGLGAMSITYTSATSCWISSFLPVVFTPHTRRILKRLHFPQPNNIHVHRKLIYSPYFKSLAEIECKKPMLSEAIHCWKKRVLPLFRSLISSRGESRLCKSRDFGISTWSIHFCMLTRWRQGDVIEVWTVV